MTTGGWQFNVMESGSFLGAQETAQNAIPSSSTWWMVVTAVESANPGDAVNDAWKQAAQRIMETKTEINGEEHSGLSFIGLATAQGGDRLLDATFMQEVQRLTASLKDQDMWSLRELIRTMLQLTTDGVKHRALSLIVDAISYNSIVELRAPAKREALCYVIEKSLSIGRTDQELFDGIVRTLTSKGFETFPKRDNAEEC
jgi:hypothetical protein